MPVLTFLSDYGVEDEFVGVCRAVMSRIAPAVRIVDLTHSVERHDVRSGALALRRAAPYLPDGVHLAVVDPGVGTERRAVALRCADEDHILVGPDNGLLMLAAERLGGIVEAFDVSRSRWCLQPVSATFHGRDVFSPVAARLAGGRPLARSGEPMDPAQLRLLELPVPHISAGKVLAHAIDNDRFGNVLLNVEHSQLAPAGLKIGDELDVNGSPAHYARTFSDVPQGALLVYEDASHTIALAVNRGSAEATLAINRDDEILIQRVG